MSGREDWTSYDTGLDMCKTSGRMRNTAWLATAAFSSLSVLLFLPDERWHIFGWSGVLIGLVLGCVAFRDFRILRGWRDELLEKS